MITTEAVFPLKYDTYAYGEATYTAVGCEFASPRNVLVTSFGNAGSETSTIDIVPFPLFAVYAYFPETYVKFGAVPRPIFVVVTVVNVWPAYKIFCTFPFTSSASVGDSMPIPTVFAVSRLLTTMFVEETEKLNVDVVFVDEIARLPAE